MRQYWERYKQALALSRWPVMSAEEIRQAEQKRKIDKLYGKVR